MAVYVDNAAHNYRGMLMCHMWADTLPELHRMADAIGVRRKWFQTPPKASWDHYDICRTKKALALKRGAVLTDKYAPLYHASRQTKNWRMCLQISMLRLKWASK